MKSCVQQCVQDLLGLEGRGLETLGESLEAGVEGRGSRGSCNFLFDSEKSVVL